MATWVNILDVLYPVGAVYFSTASTSPASTVGGSWTQIKGAVIAAYGSNGYTLKNYGGSLAIANSHLPANMGSFVLRSGYQENVSRDIDILMSPAGVISRTWAAWSGTHNVIDTFPIVDPQQEQVKFAGGGRTSYLDTLEFIFGTERPNYFTSLGGDLVWQLL